MALSPEDCRILSQARSIILRESLAAQAELGRLAALREWASQILGVCEDPTACENASVAARLAGEAAVAIQRQDRLAMNALDHIDDLNPPRE